MMMVDSLVYKQEKENKEILINWNSPRQQYDTDFSKKLMSS